MCLPLGANGAFAEEYALGVQDRIRITVHEWRATLGEVYDWKAVSGDFTIGASGAVSLPLLGSVQAGGLTTAELAKSVSEHLKAKVGLTAMPDTAVEVLQFRPFYIVGKVERQGEYAYRPGLTVLQAVSVAGGLYRSMDSSLLRLDREAISTEGNLNGLISEADQFIARRARLRAELQGLEVIPFPSELSRPEGDSVAAVLMNQEQLILKARRDALKSQTDALQELKNLLTKEVASLGTRIELKDRQIALVRKELDSTSTLVSKGLAVAPRQFSLERAEAEVETNRLELDTALLRARQEISRADRNILELQSQRRNEVLGDLRQVTASLEQTMQKIQTTQKLIAESDNFAAQYIPGGTRDQSAQPVFSIVRGSGSEAVESVVSDVTLVMPGDIIKVGSKSNRRPIGLPSMGNDAVSDAEPTSRPDAQKPPGVARTGPSALVPTMTN